MTERRAAGATWDGRAARDWVRDTAEKQRRAICDRIPARRQETTEVCVAVSTLTSPAHRIVPNHSAPNRQRIGGESEENNHRDTIGIPPNRKGRTIRIHRA